MTEKLKPGDWIGTLGEAGSRFWLKWVYAGIYAYAKARYAGVPNAITDVTHVRLYLGAGRLFEMTWPVGRIVTLKDAELADKFAAGKVRVARWSREDIQEARLNVEAMRWIGKPYDVGDLADFAITGWAAKWNWLITHGPLRFVGDRQRRYGVCSTTAAKILARSGVIFTVDLNGIDPNYPFNMIDTGGPWCAEDITRQLTRESFT